MGHNNKAGSAKKVGRPFEARRRAYAKKFHLEARGPNLRKRLTAQTLDYLDNCKDDAARRLLLGISR